MKKTDNWERNNIVIERIILIVFGFYSGNIILGALAQKWFFWSVILIGMGYAISLGVHIARYKTYQVRSMITSFFIVQLIFFEGFLTNDFERFIPTMFVLVVLISLYGFREYITMAGVVIMLLMAREITKAVLFSDDSWTSVGKISQVGNACILLFIVGITIRIRNKMIQKSREELEEREAAEKAKDDFMANVSHEIRTPLNSIYGMAELLLTDDDPQSVKEEIANIESASRNLLSMVSDILDYSELQSGNVELEEEVYDLTSTMNDVISMTEARIGDRNIEFIVDLDTTMPKLLLGDEKKIRRIVMNLINNALKFTERGCVVLSVGARRESYGLNLTISVKDTGSGMTEEMIENLFSSYNQADTGRDRQAGGIGLGLSISRLLAKKLGGVISVRSKLGWGSRFSFVVPQRVVSDTPIVELEDKENLSVICYFNMEKIEMVEVRDEYMSMLANISHNFDVSNQICSGMEEFKRNIDRKSFTHVFIGSNEYMEDPDYFAALADRQTLVVVEGDLHENQSITEKALRISKPFYALPVATLLNNKVLRGKQVSGHVRRFTAPGAKVLVVDDNLMNIKVIEGLLARYQIKVVRALSGMEALKKVRSMDYDFIFMDHMMPGMDGVETTHRIRSFIGSYYQKVPIVALTANAIAGSREMFLREGMTDFLEKPVEPSVLERVLRRNIPNDKQIPIEEQEILISKPKGEDVTEPSKPREEAKGLWTVCDRKTGLTYCGTESLYYNIIMENVKFYEEMSSRLEKDLATEDFADYVIQIHALKSSMKNIGAMELSDKAKALELAGKAGNMDVIRAGHREVMRDYRELMELAATEPSIRELLGDDFQFGEGDTPKTDQSGDELQKLNAEKLEGIRKRFEQAMYSLDEESMNACIEELKGYSLDGEDLPRVLEKISHKVQTGDYFSAGDLLASLGKEGGAL